MHALLMLTHSMHQSTAYFTRCFEVMLSLHHVHVKSLFCSINPSMVVFRKLKTILKVLNLFWHMAWELSEPIESVGFFAQPGTAWHRVWRQYHVTPPSTCHTITVLLTHYCLHNYQSIAHLWALVCIGECS